MPGQRIWFFIGIVGLLVVTACVPTVSEEWLVQPVDGVVFHAESMQALTGARIVNLDNPELSMETDATGRFQLAGESRRGVQMMLPASHLAAQLWKVSHPKFNDAVAISLTLAPALEEQPSHLSIPLFTKTETDSSPNCHFGGYLLRLGEWIKDGGSDHNHDFDQLIYHTPCDDPEIRERLTNLSLEIHAR